LDHAKALGLDVEAFKKCFDSQATTETLADHHDLFKATKAQGLPTTFIGREVLRGAGEPALVREIFAKALAPEPASVPGPIYVAIVVALAGAITFGLRRSGATPAAANNA
jgi:predicted DsbA family dithiol-disulfide isomerase